MSSRSDFVALTVNDEEVTLDEVMLQAKWSEQLAFVELAVRSALVSQAAARLGLEVSEEELQGAADRFREARSLVDVGATESWLAERLLTFDDWEQMLERELLETKLRKAVVAPQVDRYFAEHRLAYDTAAVSRIRVTDEDLARELRAQVGEEGADFHALARRFSTDEATRPAGGYGGVVHRADLEPELQAAVFGAQPHDVVGPFKSGVGWELLKIESITRATLDDGTRTMLEERLFVEWLDEERGRARIEPHLLA